MLELAERGWSLIELLVATAIISVVGVLGVMAAHGSIESGRAVKCISNLRQWGVALAGYIQDHDGKIPRRGQGVRPVEMIDREDDWFNALPAYLDLPAYSKLVQTGRKPKAGEQSIFLCPSATDAGQAHFLAYGMNMYLSPWIRPDMHRLQEIPKPSQLAFLADGPGGWSSTVPSSQGFSVQARHRNRANVLFVDGHVQAFERDYLGCGTGEVPRPDIRWQTETAGINQAPLP